MFAISLVFALLAFAAPDTSSNPAKIDYTLRVDPANLTRVSVAMGVAKATANLTLAAHAHPEYDDRYWRYLDSLTATDAAGRSISVRRIDSVRWRLSNAAGLVTIRYFVRYPASEGLRASWRPFLAPTGGLVGGPHSFLYVVGSEDASATVTLDIPSDWRVASGLSDSPTARVLNAPDIHTLMESPMLVGALRTWDFRVSNVLHRVAYWPRPDAKPFDTTAFVGGIRKLAEQTVSLFGSAPYQSYTFLMQDGAYSGGLEHPNSVTMGAPSEELARDPYAIITEVAHEFIHTWNLMAIKPMEYRKVDYRVQQPVPTLWFSEGLTIFYADLLRRRAGLPVEDSTRVSHLEGLISRYIDMPGNYRFSAERVSSVEYNAPEGALGDYVGSSHLQGELIGAMLDLHVRNSTAGQKSMDDVMRLMYQRFRNRGFTGRDIQAAVDETCRCSSAEIFDRSVRNAGTIDFNARLRSMGYEIDSARAIARRADGTPVTDLRVWAWQVDGEPYLRLRVTDPGSVWGRAGLHTDDQLVSINATPVRNWGEFRAFLSRFGIGDSATIVVQRPGGPFTAKVVMQSLVRPTVRIRSVETPTAAQLELRENWLNGN